MSDVQARKAIIEAVIKDLEGKFKSPTKPICEMPFETYYQVVLENKPLLHFVAQVWLGLLFSFKELAGVQLDIKYKPMIPIEKATFIFFEIYHATKQVTPTELIAQLRKMLNKRVASIKHMNEGGNPEAERKKRVADFTAAVQKLIGGKKTFVDVDLVAILDSKEVMEVLPQTWLTCALAFPQIGDQMLGLIHSRVPFPNERAAHLITLLRDATKPVPVANFISTLQFCKELLELVIPVKPEQRMSKEEIAKLKDLIDTTEKETVKKFPMFHQVPIVNLIAKEDKLFQLAAKHWQEFANYFYDIGVLDGEVKGVEGPPTENVSFILQCLRDTDKAKTEVYYNALKKILAQAEFHN